MPRIIDNELVNDNTFSFNDLENENIDNLLYTSFFIIFKDINSFLSINLVIMNNNINKQRYMLVIKDIKLEYDKLVFKLKNINEKEGMVKEDINIYASFLFILFTFKNLVVSIAEKGNPVSIDIIIIKAPYPFILNKGIVIYCKK